MLQFISVTTGKWNESCYIVFDKNLRAIIIDPGDDFDLINIAIIDNNLTTLAILCTHAHFDHIASVSELKDLYKIPFYLHSGDYFLLKQANFYKQFFDGKKNISIPTVDVDLLFTKSLKFGDIQIQVIETPGHTDGGVSFLIENMLFVGDNLINYKIGSTKLPGGNKEKLKQSIRNILSIDNCDLILLAGHGDKMTLSQAKKLCLLTKS
jgi:glyoxylase-like metal-dependent hydrolase (beta-lactamase superfamily II)